MSSQNSSIERETSRRNYSTFCRILPIWTRNRLKKLALELDFLNPRDSFLANTVTDRGNYEYLLSLKNPKFSSFSGSIPYKFSIQWRLVISLDFIQATECFFTWVYITYILITYMSITIWAARISTEKFIKSPVRWCILLFKEAKMPFTNHFGCVPNVFKMLRHQSFF